MSHETIQTRGHCSRAGHGGLDEVLAELCERGNAARQSAATPGR